MSSDNADNKQLKEEMRSYKIPSPEIEMIYAVMIPSTWPQHFY